MGRQYKQEAAEDNGLGDAGDTAAGSTLDRRLLGEAGETDGHGMTAVRTGSKSLGSTFFRRQTTRRRALDPRILPRNANRTKLIRISRNPVQTVK